MLNKQAKVAKDYDTDLELMYGGKTKCIPLPPGTTNVIVPNLSKNNLTETN